MWWPGGQDCMCKEKNDQLVAKGIQFLSSVAWAQVGYRSTMSMSPAHKNNARLEDSEEAARTPCDGNSRSTAATQWPQSPFEAVGCTLICCKAGLIFKLVWGSDQDPNVLSGICEKARTLGCQCAVGRQEAQSRGAVCPMDSGGLSKCLAARLRHRAV